MARIIYPDDFAGQQTLFTAILAQHKTLGTKSPLTPFAKQQKMDLSKLEAAIKASATQDGLSQSLKRDSENDTQQRDLALAEPWAHLLGEVQFLKNFYAGSERELGAWAVTVDGNGRIVYPVTFAERVKLVQDFLAKHNSYDPGESPLQWYIDEHDIDVSADLKAAGDALTDDADKDTLSGQSELATQTRNTIWAPAVEAIHKIGAFLMGLYHENSRKMAAWGFDVAEDAAGEREQVTTIDPNTSKTITSVTIPGVLENIGTDALDVTKGKGEKSETFTVQPGGKLGMVKGFSTIVITNRSMLEMGKVRVMVNK